jgi:hypothetical protein
MGKPELLIAIPTKSGEHYAARAKACCDTWLKDCPCDFKMFSDADMGLTEIDQHDNVNDPIRCHRTKLMVKYAYENGYDNIFRVDADAYVWINRLLNSGFEQHDYMGWCLDYPKHLETDIGRRTAHGGIGFFLSRKAMQVIVNAPVERCIDGKFWGDIWVGEQLWKRGIYCHRDTRFLDGSYPPQHQGNIAAHELPLDHQYISVHPTDPITNVYEIQKRFPRLSDQTVPPERQLWHKEPNWNIGGKRPDICPCDYCHAK